MLRSVKYFRDDYSCDYRREKLRLCSTRTNAIEVSQAQYKKNGTSITYQNTRWQCIHLRSGFQY